MIDITEYTNQIITVQAEPEYDVNGNPVQDMGGQIMKCRFTIKQDTVRTNNGQFITVDGNLKTAPEDKLKRDSTFVYLGDKYRVVWVYQTVDLDGKHNHNRYAVQMI